MKTFALIAYLATAPGHTNEYVIDHGLTHVGCLIAISEPYHTIPLGDGAVIVIEGEEALSCEAERRSKK